MEEQVCEKRGTVGIHRDVDCLKLNTTISCMSASDNFLLELVLFVCWFFFKIICGVFFLAGGGCILLFCVFVFALFCSLCCFSFVLPLCFVLFCFVFIKNYYLSLNKNLLSTITNHFNETRLPNSFNLSIMKWDVYITCYLRLHFVSTR